MNKLKISFPLVVLLLGIFTACNKPDNLYGHKKYIGDYDWSESLVNTTTTVTMAESNMRFGLRLKKNGTVYFYRNEEQIGEGEIQSIDAYSGDQIKITVSYQDKTYEMTATDSSIQCPNWPTNGLFNNFVKIK
jgi:hypothetical protein